MLFYSRVYIMCIVLLEYMPLAAFDRGVALMAMVIILCASTGQGLERIIDNVYRLG